MAKLSPCLRLAYWPLQARFSDANRQENRPLFGLTLGYPGVDTNVLNSDFQSKTGKAHMSSSDSPAELPQLRDVDRRPVSAALDAPEAVIAALDEAEVAFDADSDAGGRLADSSTDAIEILDAEPILTEDEPLAGAPDPVDLITRRAKNETPRDRVALYQSELAAEPRTPQQAVLLHEIARYKESALHEDAEEVARAYAQTQSVDSGLRGNLWALRRLAVRRRDWQELLGLIDIEIKHATTRRERADLWAEKGHILEDLLSDVEEAIICYRTAHEIDAQSLAPLAALEKLMVQRGSEAGRPSAELLSVYRGLTNATRDPGRRVALLIELARYEEDVLHLDQPGHAGDVDRVLAYLHDAFDVGIDQLRVVDEIIRLTASAGRIPDCLAALEVKAEILEGQAQQASSQRQSLLLDQVVAIRRFQTALARDRMGNAELAWQYLEKAHQRSPGDPLLLPDLIALAEAQGRYEQLSDLLAQMEETHRIAHGEDPPPLGLWLKRAVTLRLAGQDALADELEASIAKYTPTHLLLLLARQRRAMREPDFAALVRLFQEEAQLAHGGLSERKDAAAKSDPTWALDTFLVAATMALRSNDLAAAKDCLARAQALATGAEAPSQQQQLGELTEELHLRGRQFRELATLYESRLAAGLGTTAPGEATRLHELLIDLYSGPLADPGRALAFLQPLINAAPEDLRLRRLAVLLRRRSGDISGEIEALAELLRVEQKQGLGPSLAADVLRRAELLAQTGDAAAATALYEQVLAQHPGEPQALDAIEQLLRRSGRAAELAQVLRRQIEVAQAQLSRGGDEQGSLAQRILLLQASLSDAFENEAAQPEQAAMVYRSVAAQRMEYVPPLWSLERLLRRRKDAAGQARALEQLAETLPTGPTRAALWLRLGDLLRRQSGSRPSEAEAAYGRSFQSMPLPSAVAAHAVLGRQQALLQSRAQGKLGEVYEAWLDTLAPDEPSHSLFTGVFAEERAHFSSESGTVTAMERSEALLNKALQDLRLDANASQQAPELLPLLEWGRYQLACRRSDGKQQGVALAGLAAYLTPRIDAAARPTVGALWLRAGLLGALNEDEQSQKVEAARRLLQAYRLLGDVPQVLVPLCDLLEDGAILEPLVREPEIIPVLRARQAIAPSGEVDDRLLWTLMEAEVWLQRGEGDDVDVAMRTRCAQEAAEAAMRALALDGQNIIALLLLRQATAPGNVGGSELAPGAALSSEDAARLRAYGLYTLRLAGLLSVPETQAELYNEAAQIFVKLGDSETAAAALRVVLDSTPLDDAAFAQLRGLLTTRAEDSKKPDAGPLLELLNFRLALVAEDEAQERAERSLRTSLLLQRAGLFQAAGQMGPAAADLQALLQLDPRQPAAHRRLAELQAQKGNSDAAILHYEQFLALGGTPAERQAVHVAVGRLLSVIDPARALPHVQQAIELGHKYRELRGDEVDTAEEVTALADLYRWQEKLQLSLGQAEAAIATLRELDKHIPRDEQFFEERQRVAIEIANVLESAKGDRAAAISSLEQLLTAEPLALSALERLASLVQAAGESNRAQGLYRKFIDEARRLARESVSRVEPAKPAPFQALAKIFGWQKAGDAQQLATQAAMASGAGGVPRAPAPKLLPKPVTAPLKSAAFSAEARGVLLDLWLESAETANRLLAPELKTLGTDLKERLNAKQVPQVWSTVDELARKFGMGTSDRPYGLYMSRERELCQLSGNNLVCGSNFSGSLRDLSSSRYCRLLRRLVLLPDRLGPVDGELTELLLYITACCQLVGLPGPTIPTELKNRLDERLRVLDRAISRKERGALRNLAARLAVLNGEAGRGVIATWQEEVRMGAAQLALALSGDVQGVLSDLSVSPNDGDATSARMARRILSFAVSEDVLTIRRDLGVSE